MTFKTFLDNTRGNVAISLGIALVPLMAAVGVAVDYNSVVYARTSADAAADTAVLAALKTAQEAFTADDPHWRDKGEALGVSVFNQNLRAKSVLNEQDPKIKIKRKGQDFDVELTYDVVYPTRILQLISQDSVRLRNKVSAASGGDNYLSIHFVIDTSSSMGIGANVVEQQKMVDSAAMGNCAFACHFDKSSIGHETISTAKNLGIKLRIDIVQNAVSKFLKKLKDLHYSHNQIEVTLHTFANDLKTIQPATTDLEDAIDATANIELDRSWGQGGTNLENSLKQLAQTLSVSGDGSTPSKRRSFVVVLGDAVEDSDLVLEDPANPGYILWRSETAPKFTTRPGEYFQESPGITLQAPSRASCDPIKDKGHTVLLTQVAYVPPLNPRPHDLPRLDYINNELMQGVARDALQTCATQPNYAFYARDSNEVEPAFDAILDIIRNAVPPRLTN